MDGPTDCHTEWQMSEKDKCYIILLTCWNKEGWAPKNGCFQTVVLEKTLESPLDCKEIQSVNSKRNQSWIFIGRTDTEAPILWPCDANSWLIGKDPDAGERLKAGGEEGDRGWDGWMASLTQWTWGWVNSGGGWWTRKPCVLWSVGSQSQTWLNDWTTNTYMFMYNWFLCCPPKTTATL